MINKVITYNNNTIDIIIYYPWVYKYPYVGC